MSSTNATTNGAELNCSTQGNSFCSTSTINRMHVLSNDFSLTNKKPSFCSLLISIHIYFRYYSEHLTKSVEYYTLMKDWDLAIYKKKEEKKTIKVQVVFWLQSLQITKPQLVRTDCRLDIQCFEIHNSIN